MRMTPIFDHGFLLHARTRPGKEKKKKKGDPMRSSTRGSLPRLPSLTSAQIEREKKKKRKKAGERLRPLV